MAGIDRLRQLMRQLRDELASMRAQVELTPNLLSDRERKSRTEDGSEDQQARSVRAHRGLIL